MEQKRKIVPPVYFLFTLAMMIGMYYLLPIAYVIDYPIAYVGLVLIVCGLASMLTAVGAFRKAGTPLIPFEPSTALVVQGMYKITRNPMYLGMVLILTGTGLLLGPLGSFLPIPLFILIIDFNFIRGEERFLEDIFGEEYLAYKRQVRRWI